MGESGGGWRDCPGTALGRLKTAAYDNRRNLKRVGWLPCTIRQGARVFSFHVGRRPASGDLFDYSPSCIKAMATLIRRRSSCFRAPRATCIALRGLEAYVERKWERLVPHLQHGDEMLRHRWWPSPQSTAAGDFHAEHGFGALSDMGAWIFPMPGSLPITCRRLSAARPRGFPPNAGQLEHGLPAANAPSNAYQTSARIRSPTCFPPEDRDSSRARQPMAPIAIAHRSPTLHAQSRQGDSRPFAHRSLRSAARLAIDAQSLAISG